MDETEKSLPALCFSELMLQEKKGKKNSKKTPHHQIPQTSKKPTNQKKNHKKPLKQNTIKPTLQEISLHTEMLGFWGTVPVFHLFLNPKSSSE